MSNDHLTRRLADGLQHDRIAAAASFRAAAGARSRRRRALLASLLPASLIAFALPAAAQAGTATSLVDGTLLYSDTTPGGERNDVTLRSAGGRIVISDGRPVGSATTACKVAGGVLECANHRSVRVILGAGDDRLEYRLPHAGIVQMGSGDDTVHAGTRESAGRPIEAVTLAGEDGHDVLDYGRATNGVAVDMADGIAADGRPGDREDAGGFEHLNGSPFRDTLFGTPGRDGIAGGGERDVIAGGAGDDFFYSAVKDGADDYHGGPGRDGIVYVGRTQPLRVDLDNVADDGETGEADNVRTNVETVVGGSGPDTLTSFGTFSRLEGLGGADTLTGGDGPDTLVGGSGRDAMEARGGIDTVDARDGEPDFVDCGTEADTLTRDLGEGVVRGCETVTR